MVIRKLFMPETLLSLSYIGVTIYNTTILYRNQELVSDAKWKLAKHLALITVLLLIIIIDMALRVSKLTSQV